jgi:ABC-type nitrate/sulfonate/bicarbonate transport system ATPase subunit
VQRLTGVTTLHVTHSLTEARRLADRLFMLDDNGLRGVEGERDARSSDAIQEGQ